MSVLSRSFKQTNGYFVPVGNCQGKIWTYSGNSGAGGSAVVGSFSVAAWSAPTTPNAASTTAILVSSLIAGPSAAAGGLFKDMGKTVVSASRTFRKIQMVVPGLSSAGVGEFSPDQTFLTGYIELAGAGGLANGTSNAAPVAYLPGLM